MRMARSSSSEFIGCLALLCALSLFSACGGVGRVDSPSSQFSSIAITPATAQIRAGDTRLFVA